MRRGWLRSGWLGLLALLVSATAGEARDFNLRANFVPPQGGEIAGFLRIDAVRIPDPRIRAGEELLIEFDVTNLNTGSDTIVNITAFGNWFPITPLHHVVHFQSLNSLGSRRTLQVRFETPGVPGEYRVRLLAVRNAYPLESYFGGRRQQINPPETSFDSGADLWTEIPFVIKDASLDQPGTRLPLVPGFPDAARPVPPAPPSGDYCDPARRLQNLNGRREGYLEFRDYAFHPEPMAGRPTTLSVTFSDLRRQDVSAEVSCAVYGSWQAEPLGIIYRGEPRNRIPETVTKDIRFRAPRRAGTYKIRWLWVEGNQIPIGFNGAFAEADRSRQGPDAWTEFEFAVAPLADLRERLRAARPGAGIVRFDELASPDIAADRKVDFIGGDYGGWFTVKDAAIHPPEPSTGSPTELRLDLEFPAAAPPGVAAAGVYGDWMDGLLAPLDLRQEGEPAGAAARVVRFPAPPTPGSHQVRIVVGRTDDAVADFFGTGASRDTTAILAWSGTTFTVTGEAAMPGDEGAWARAVIGRLESGKPVIDHLPGDRVASALDLTVFATIIARNELARAVLVYRYFEAGVRSEWKSVEMKPLGPAVDDWTDYQGVIPAPDVRRPLIEYYLWCEDRLGNRAAYPFSDDPTDPEREARQRPVSVPVVSDGVAPRFAEFNPPPASAVRENASEISLVIYEDDLEGSSGIDPSQVRMLLDGLEVTPELIELGTTEYGTVTRYRVVYRPPGGLPSDQHHVTVKAYDFSNNPAETDWTFNVERVGTTVAGWTATLGATNQNLHTWYAPSDRNSGQRTSLTNTWTGRLDKPLNQTWRVESSFSMTDNIPHSYDPVNDERQRDVGEMHVTAKCDTFTATAGDVYSEFPALITSNSSFRGALARENLNLETWGGKGALAFIQAGEFHRVGYGSSGGSAKRDRTGARLKYSWGNYGSDYLGTTWLSTEENPYTVDDNLFGSRTRGRVWGLDTRLTFFQSCLTIDGSYANSEENQNLDDPMIVGDNNEIAYDLAAAYRKGTLSLGTSLHYGQLDFGKVSYGSGSKDNRTWSSNGNWSPWTWLSLNGTYSNSRDDLNLNKEYVTTTQSGNAGFNLNRPKWPSFGYTWSRGLTQNNLAPETIDNVNQSHGINLSYSYDFLNLSYSHSLSHNRDNLNEDGPSHSHTSSRSQSISGGINKSFGSRYLSANVSFSPSTQKDYINQTVSRGGSASWGFSFDLLPQTLKFSYNGSRTFNVGNTNYDPWRTATVSKGLTLGLTATLPTEVKYLDGTLTTQFQENRSFDLATDGNNYTSYSSSVTANLSWSAF